MFNCFDDGSMSEFNEEVQAGNPLAFPGMDERLATAREKTGLRCACITFEARVEGTQAVVAVLAGAFRGGSVGAAEGAKFVAAAERARRKRFPFIVYCHGTAGIRIQEGTHGVIQMPRCTVAVRRYVEAGGLYLVIYDTNSYGGPVASFLGCAHYQFAIRSSNIGFAGPGSSRIPPAVTSRRIIITVIRPLPGGISREYGTDATCAPTLNRPCSPWAEEIFITDRQGVPCWT